MASAIQNYKAKNEYMSQYYEELDALTFYSEIFPPETLEKKNEAGARKSNPIVSYKVKEPDRSYFRNEIVFADTFEETIAKTQKNEMALCSMVSYCGKRKTAQNAFKCHGFCIDLDGVEMLELTSFWGWVEDLKKIPCPTYVANSGHGLHVYYLFENPVPLYPQVVEHLQKLKRGLTGWVWNRETSNYKPQERQFQGIYQGFRMVGSCSKLGRGKARSKYPVRVWRTGKPWTIEQLNRYVEDEFKAPNNPDYSSWLWADEKHVSLAEAKELYPEWYANRIDKGLPSNQWFCSKGLYDWWLDKLQSGAKDGTRYHCISTLYVYAIKCGIPKELVDADALNLIEPLNELTKREDNEFTEDDITAASKFYQPKFAKMTRKEIARKTQIQIEPSRRRSTPLSKADNLKLARMTQTIRDPEGSWRNKNGRPTKQALVEEWQKNHPDGKKCDCIIDTGLSKPTVYKFWKN